MIVSKLYIFNTQTIIIYIDIFLKQGHFLKYYIKMIYIVLGGLYLSMLPFIKLFYVFYNIIIVRPSVRSFYNF